MRSSLLIPLIQAYRIALSNCIHSTPPFARLSLYSRVSFNSVPMSKNEMISPKAETTTWLVSNGEAFLVDRFTLSPL